MVLLVLVILMYGIPISIGILLLRWLLLKYYDRQRINFISLSMFVGLVHLILGFFSWYMISSRHFTKVAICQSAQLSIYAVEIESFLEYPVDFELEIRNSSNEIVCVYDFFMPEGPDIEVKIEQPNLIVITGYNSNINFTETIRLQNIEFDCDQRWRMDSKFNLIEQ